METILKNKFLFLRTKINYKNIFRKFEIEKNFLKFTMKKVG